MQSIFFACYFYSFGCNKTTIWGGRFHELQIINKSMKIVRTIRRLSVFPLNCIMRKVKCVRAREKYNQNMYAEAFLYV